LGKALVRFSIAVVLAEVVLAILADLAAPYPYNAIDLRNRLQTPSISHLLGTDHLGRDVFSRLLHAIRVTLLISVSSVVLALVAGVALGILAAVIGGVVDYALSRVFEALYALPSMFIAASMLLILGSNPISLVIAIALSLSPLFYRLSKSIALETLVKPYIEASKVLGAPISWIIKRHVLREVMASLAPATVHILSYAISMEATFGVVGLSLDPSIPSLGNMLREYKDYILNPETMWLPMIPVAIIAVSIFSLNIIAFELGRVLRAEQT
jgi:ABC-type dipeptide/oligopeptide/nickel transport system permease subunit